MEPDRIYKRKINNLVLGVHEIPEISLLNDAN